MKGIANMGCLPTKKGGIPQGKVKNVSSQHAQPGGKKVIKGAGKK